MSRASEKNAELRKLEIKANDEYRLKKVHTETELDYVLRMAELCQDISDINAAYPDEKEKWRRKKEYYNDRAREIEIFLASQKPKPEPKPEPEPESKTVPGFRTNSNNGGGEQETETAPARTMDKDSRFACYAEKFGSPIPDEGYISPNSSKEVPPEMIRNWYQDFPDHDLNDIVGMDELKEKAKRDILNKIGWEMLDKSFSMPTLKSYLFYGPYGTGKTFFVEGLSMELMKRGFKFLRLGGSDVHGKYVGSGEKVVRAAFNEAKSCAPCILFFDEFDNICADRDGATVEGHEKRLSNEFIQEYDKLKKSKNPVVVLTATNYPDKIDDAMLSRILTSLLIPLPEESLRQLYFRNEFKKFKTSDDIDFDYMADETDNFSMRDLDKIKFYIKNDILESAKERFGVKGDDGEISPELSQKAVIDAISSGRISITKELFDTALEKNPPEKKDDILASLKAFSEKK